MKKFKIKSGQGAYLVEFLDKTSLVNQKISQFKNPVIIIDENLIPLYKNLAQLSFKYPTLKLKANEKTKTLEGIAQVISFLQKHKCTKETTLVAIGGGIIQDVVTFTAHVYFRGIKWVFFPTTLLSMTDSCIGAKTGINFGPYKNQLGVFHSPSYIGIAFDFLKTLGKTDILSGSGEILKLLLTGPKKQFDNYILSVNKTGIKNNKDLHKFIKQSLIIKKEVIEDDEYEADRRRVLNYGHTFGHALESVTKNEIPHGIAVAWGIDVENYLAFKKGVLSEKNYQEIHWFIKKHFPFTMRSKYSVPALIKASLRDKKVMQGKLILALLKQPGNIIIDKVSPDTKLSQEIKNYLKNEDVLHWH